MNDLQIPPPLDGEYRPPRLTETALFQAVAALAAKEAQDGIRYRQLRAQQYQRFLVYCARNGLDPMPEPEFNARLDRVADIPPGGSRLGSPS